MEAADRRARCKQESVLPAGKEDLATMETGYVPQIEKTSKQFMPGVMSITVAPL